MCNAINIAIGILLAHERLIKNWAIFYTFINKNIVKQKISHKKMKEKLQKFYNTATPEKIIKDLENLGVEFEDINSSNKKNTMNTMKFQFKNKDDMWDFIESCTNLVTAKSGNNVTFIAEVTPQNKATEFAIGLFANQYNGTRI